MMRFSIPNAVKRWFHEPAFSSLEELRQAISTKGEEYLLQSCYWRPRDHTPEHPPLHRAAEFANNYMNGIYGGCIVSQQMYLELESLVAKKAAKKFGLDYDAVLRKMREPKHDGFCLSRDVECFWGFGSAPDHVIDEDARSIVDDDPH